MDKVPHFGIRPTQKRAKMNHKLLPDVVQMFMESQQAREDVNFGFKIQSSSNGFGQLILTWTPKGEPNIPHNFSHRPWRRKSPSEMRRDSDRKRQFQRNNSFIQVVSDEENVTVKQREKSGHVGEIGQSTNTHLKCDLRTAPVMGDQHVNDTSIPHTNKNNSYTCTTPVHPLPVEQSTAIVTDNSDSNEDPDCVKCNKQITENIWFRCTDPDCGKLEVEDYCSRECIADHCHNDQISIFRYQEDESNDHFCYSCGSHFKHGSEFYRCKLCDDYELCTNCLNQGMHMKHRRHMDKITRKKPLFATC